MRPRPFLASLAFLAACSSDPKAERAEPVAPTPGTKGAAATSHDGALDVYDIPLHTLEGTPTTLAPYRGKALLLVNVASECGLTPQYAKLQELQQSYGARGFSVIGFPCNQFGGQEPGGAKEIRSFCEANYHVSFPLMEKIEVNGAGRHPLYAELTAVPDASGEAGDVQWNFEKFLVSADGRSVQRFRPRTTPDDPKLVAALEGALPD